jgi:hypothetical protein
MGTERTPAVAHNGRSVSQKFHLLLRVVSPSADDIVLSAVRKEEIRGGNVSSPELRWAPCDICGERAAEVRDRTGRD